MGFLLALFIVVPLIEISLFIQVGGAIGLWPTLGIVVVTAIAGTILMRSQGIAALAKLQQSLNEFSDPTGPLAHGALIVVAGLLLLTPGFFTDACGFALLFPPVREQVITSIRRRVSNAPGFQVNMHAARDPRRGMRDDIIDGDYTDLDETSANPTTSRPSGWTRH